MIKNKKSITQRAFSSKVLHLGNMSVEQNRRSLRDEVQRKVGYKIHLSRGILLHLQGFLYQPPSKMPTRHMGQ